MTAAPTTSELANNCPPQQSLRVQRFVRHTGHRKCRVSSGIHDCLTFGHGELDHNGFWEHGCYECARAHEQQFPNDGPCWPHTPKQIAEMFPEDRPNDTLCRPAGDAGGAQKEQSK